MKFIDTHSHMYLPHFSEDLEEVMERAADKAVSKIVLPNIDSQTIDLVDEMTGAFPNLCLPLMGLHPTHVKEDYETELEKIFNQFSKGEYYGVGEIGIDLYWDKTFYEQQEDAFKRQIKYALQNHLPFIIHARDSYEEIFKVLNSINAGNYKGIFHAFTGTPDDAEKIIDMGFKIGIGGILTFKNSGLSETVQMIDINHIVLETDSPYLAPAPYRGKRNESGYIPIIADCLAEIKDVSVEEIARVTTHNANEVFQINEDK